MNQSEMTGSFFAFCTKTSHIIDNYKEQDNLLEYFDLKGWIGKTAKAVKGAEYNLEKHPCASIIKGAFSAMGIALSKTWGSAYAVDYPDDGVPSNYVISREYIKGNGYTKSGATMSFKDAHYFTYRASLW